MTVTLVRPDTTTLPAIETPCPPWCAGDCADWADGARYHGSAFTDVKGVCHDVGPAVVAVSATRLDEAGSEPVPSVNMLIGREGRISHEDVSFTPEQARQLAAALLASADNAELREVAR
jgi:hypothetical protein